MFTPNMFHIIVDIFELAFLYVTIWTVTIVVLVLLKFLLCFFYFPKNICLFLQLFYFSILFCKQFVLVLNQVCHIPPPPPPPQSLTMKIFQVLKSCLSFGVVVVGVWYHTPHHHYPKFGKKFFITYLNQCRVLGL